MIHLTTAPTPPHASLLWGFQLKIDLTLQLDISFSAHYGRELLSVAFLPTVESEPTVECSAGEPWMESAERSNKKSSYTINLPLQAQKLPLVVHRRARTRLERRAEAFMSDLSSVFMAQPLFVREVFAPPPGAGATIYEPDEGELRVFVMRSRCFSSSGRGAKISVLYLGRLRSSPGTLAKRALLFVLLFCIVIILYCRHNLPPLSCEAAQTSKRFFYLIFPTVSSL
jgi:hypothetical protein